jgi:hypothetical protein
MSLWATSSSRVLAVFGAVLALVAGAAPAAGRVYLAVDEALALAFPGCAVEHQTVFLTEAQLAEARRLAGEAVESALVHPYVARCDEEPGGVAYFDTHRVRTLPETLMIVVTPGGEVTRIEVLSFQEPPDYLPRGAWYGQFDGRALDPELDLQRGIRPVTGATLTARATTSAVRRVLAIDQVLRRAGKPGGGEPEAKPKGGGR